MKLLFRLQDFTLKFISDIENFLLSFQIQGKIEFQGVYSDFIIDERYLHLIPTDEEMESRAPSEETETLTNLQVSMVKQPSFEEDEEVEPQESEELMAKGNVAKSLYSKYFKAGGGFWSLILLVICFILAQISSSGCDYWLGYW